MTVSEKNQAIVGLEIKKQDTALGNLHPPPLSAPLLIPCIVALLYVCFVLKFKIHSIIEIMSVLGLFI